MPSEERFSSRFEIPAPQAYEPPRQRLWLHVLLLVLTLFSTTLVGAHMQYNFSHNLPFFDIEHLSAVFTVGLRSWSLFLAGLPFSLTLLTILMAHELGHYLACVYYGIDATLPFFLPSPMPVTGTFGAFIRIRSAIHSKKILFDVGIAGPLAGFVFLVPALGVGLAFSKILPGINHQGTIQLGVPALEWLAQKLIFPGVPVSDIYLHPVARAAWVGMFATALNLLPVGQLDGGHVVYALLGRSQKWITNVFLILLVPMGKLWTGWWFWAVVLFLFGRKHPPLYDQTEIGKSRVRLGIAALFIFLLCFSIAPINE
ncbi:MAG TPA: site-2 protease family protein [Bryobacteraceae bacterium]|nr:site-2 protease family protein [Bryobacteraceae bacterium]